MTNYQYTLIEYMAGVSLLNTTFNKDVYTMTRANGAHLIDWYGHTHNQSLMKWQENY